METWVGILVTIILAIFGAEWAFGVWINRQISSVKDFIYQEIRQLRDDLLGKLEYHERHDDRRFDVIRNDILEIRVRNAARDGLPVVIPKEREPLL